MGRGQNFDSANFAVSNYAQPRHHGSRARLLDSDGPNAAAHMKGPISLKIDWIMWPREGQEPENWNGSMIAKAIHGETGEVISIKGKIGPLNIGDTIEVTDRKWQDDARFGENLMIWKSRRDMSSRDGIISYLQTLPGIGPALGEAIVDQLGGVGSLEKIDADPNILLTVKTPRGYGIHQRFMGDLAAEWEAHAADRTTMVYLHSLDLGNAVAKRVYEHFGATTEAIIKADPYMLTEVEGLGFRMADRVAQEMGIKGNDPRRLGAGVAYCIEQSESDGHVCLSRGAIYERAPHLLARDGMVPSEAQLSDAIGQMVADGRLHCEDDFETGVERIYTTENFIIETRLYDRLKELLLADKLPAPTDLERPELSILTDEQWGAVERSFTERISILTGGPGTGKTTTLRGVIDELERRGQRVTCMAPTGKAAKRMAESTGREASTIHRALGHEGRATPKTVTQGADVNEGDGIYGDVVIVDETSMLDMKLAERLLSNLSVNTRIIMVGDPDQLPAVGAGSVLLDLIESGRVPVTKLTKVHRQAEGSLITVNAHRIKDGLEPFYSREEAEAELGHSVDDDFHFVEAEDANDAMRKILRMYRAAPQRLGIELDDVMLLSSQRKGNAGVWVLNRAVQQWRNQNGTVIRDGDEPLRKGDRVINTKNRYAAPNSHEPDVMNGDMGVIVDWDPKTKAATVLVDGEDVEVKFSGDDLKAIKPGYALTVHKSQGSEAPLVLMPVWSAPGSPNRVLNRNNVYTGLTRAKDKAVLVGSKAALRAALAKDGSKRNTTLDLRVARIEARLLARKERLLALKSTDAAREILFGRHGAEGAENATRKPGWMDPDNRPSWANRVAGAGV